MIDLVKCLMTKALATSAITSLLGSSPAGGVYGAPDLPEGFDPKVGSAVLIYEATGEGHAEILSEVMSLIRIRIWSDINEYQLCRNIMRAVMDAFHGMQMADFGDDGRILSCLCTSLPQVITDPDTSWVSQIATFQVDGIQTAPLALTDFVNSNQTVQQYIDQQILADITAIDGGSS